MSRPERLFQLLNALRVLPKPVTAARLALEAAMSERTLYRDIECLQAGGALIWSRWRHSIASVFNAALAQWVGYLCLSHKCNRCGLSTVSAAVQICLWQSSHPKDTVPPKERWQKRRFDAGCQL